MNNVSETLQHQRQAGPVPNIGTLAGTVCFVLRVLSGVVGAALRDAPDLNATQSGRLGSAS